MSEPVTLKLKVPIQHGSETITELRFRTPIAKDFRKLPLQPETMMDSMLTLAGRLSGQPDSVIDRIDVEHDFMEVIHVVSGFMPGGLATGSEPSPS